jgi:hypothetical protein|tara:strand:+ start:318 stop:434 length:117 start_codon:yes stop_codon:yes gene_type:complete
MVDTDLLVLGFFGAVSFNQLLPKEFSYVEMDIPEDYYR